MLIAIIRPESGLSSIIVKESYAELILETIAFIRAYDANDTAIILHDNEPIENINTVGKYLLTVSNSKTKTAFEFNIIKLEEKGYTEL